MFKSIIAVLIIGFALALSNAHAQKTDEFNLDKSYSIDEGGTIHLASDDAEVQITGSDREDVHVVVHYKLTVRGLTFGSANKFGMIVEEQNGDLTIHEKPRDFGASGIIGYSNEEYTIEIEAPWDVSMNIKGDDGEYKIVGIDGSLRLEADDTEATISDCNGDDFTFYLDDGEVEMDGGQGHLRIEADDGRVRISGAQFTDIDADSDDSTIEISTTLADGGDYRFDMDDAELSFGVTGGGGEFDIRHDDADISAGRDFERVRKDENHTVYRLMGGNARIRIRSDDGDINLRVY